MLCHLTKENCIFQHFQVEMAHECPFSSSRHSRQSRELHLVLQLSLGGRAQGEQREGKLGMTSTGPSSALMNISNL